MKFVALLLITLFNTSPLLANDWVAEDWAKDLVRSSALLKNAEYAHALKIASRVTDEMVEFLGPGRESTQAFGLALIHKSLALAGLGRFDDALWYWQTALSLYPAYANSDLSSFGQPGAFLKEHPPRIPGAASPPHTPIPESASIVNPRPLKQPSPKYPEGARQFRISGDLEVETIITKSGTVSSPRIVRPLPAPTLSYAALEAVKRWQYAPATVNGEPVEVTLTISVHFNLTR